MQLSHSEQRFLQGIRSYQEKWQRLRWLLLLAWALATAALVLTGYVTWRQLADVDEHHPSALDAYRLAVHFPVLIILTLGVVGLSVRLLGWWREGDPQSSLLVKLADEHIRSELAQSQPCDKQ